MRTQTTAQSNALASVRRLEFVRVFVENPDGVFTNLCALSGRNWFRSGTIDRTIDQPIDAATIQLRRDAGSTLSLSPTRTDSTLNRNAAAAYAPLLDVSRGIYIEVALLDPAVATTPAAGDWQRVFQGTIDSVDPAGDDIVVAARDLGARLADTWLTQPTAAVVAGAAAQPIETVIQGMLDTALGTGIVTLYTPVSPGYSVTRFGYQREPLMDAIQRLVDSIGWTCRYQWDPGTASFRLTLAQPPRTKTTPDVTFPASQYQGVRRFAIARALVRNSITIFYTDPTSGRTSAAVNDSASIARYGFRPLIIEEASDSPITTNAEALAMGNALLADLKDPKADGEWTRPLYWPAELNDLIRFPGNGVHFDTNQDLAVVGIHHVLAAEETSQTTLTLRGTPAGAYLAWLRRGGPTVGGGSPATIDPPTASITSQGATRIDETIFLSGAPGKNAPKTPFQWRYRFSRKTVGAWTAYDSGTLSVAITVPKDPLYITKIDLQVLQADGQSVIVTYWVDGRADGLDEGTGHVDPTQTLAGTSHFIPRATDVNGMNLAPGATDSRARLLNTGFQYGTDGAAGVVETSGQKFIHGSYIDGSRRPNRVYSATDASDLSADTMFEGWSRTNAALADRSANLTAAVKDSRASLLNSHGRLNVDTVDSWVDGTYAKVKAADISGNQVVRTLVVDGGRTTNSPPSAYSVGTVREFKDGYYLGVPGHTGATNAYFGALETVKHYVDSSAGSNSVTQTFRSSVFDGQVWKRSAPAAATDWSAATWRRVFEAGTQRVDLTTGHADSTMADSRSALLNAMGRANVDLLSIWLDGGGYAKVASSNVDASGNVIGAAVSLSSVLGTANLSTNQLTVTFSTSGMPSGTTYNVNYTVDATTTGNGTSGGLDNTSSGHVFSIGTFPSSTPSGTITVDAINNGRVIATKRKSGPFAL